MLCVVGAAAFAGYLLAEYHAHQAEQRESWLRYAVRELGGKEADCSYSRTPTWGRRHICTATLPRERLPSALNYPHATITEGTRTVWTGSEAVKKQGGAYRGTFTQQDGTALEGIQFSIFPSMAPSDGEASLLVSQEYNIWLGP